MPIQLLLTSILMLCLIALPAQACTRVVYHGEDNTIITGRSMDWKEDMFSNLWLFPRGMKRDGVAGKNSVAWVSKYGSVAVSGYEAGTADGMNEKGLAAGLLYLTESDYGDPKAHPEKPQICISVWMQYVLDNFATVDEAVKALKDEPFHIIAPPIPNGSPAQLHLAISDPSGDVAVFEYIAGRLVIHHGEQYQIMTNSPIYSEQLALNEYWQGIGGLTFLPGTNRAADRFARAHFLVNAIPKKKMDAYITAVPNKSFHFQAVASVASVMRSVSVPLGITTPDQPNISSTIWRTIADHKNKIYYFDSATSPNVFWVNLQELDFNAGSSVQKIKLTDGAIYKGNASKEFKSAQPLKFLPAP